MKPFNIIAVAVGLCLGGSAYAQQDVFNFLGTRADSREPDKVNPALEWGSNIGNGTYQKLMRYTTTNGNTTATPMENTYIPNLKPRGGGSFPAGAEGLVGQVWPLPNGDVLFSTEIVPGNSNYLFKMRGATGTVGNNANHDNKEAVLNMGERGTGTVADIRALHQRSILVATVNNATVLFYGEYNVNSQSPQVALWKSTDFGDNWTKVIEWNTNNNHYVDHIHGVVQNPYNGWIYILFGDEGSENGIVAWDGVSAAPPNDTPLTQIGSYSGWKSLADTPRARTGDLVFTPPPNGKCVWIPDVDSLNPGEILLAQRANYDLTGLEATGVVPFTNGLPAILGVRGKLSGNIYWASFRNAGIATPPENKLNVWRSTDSGLNWERVDGGNVNTYTPFTAVPQNLIVKESISNGVVTNNLFLSARTPQLDPSAGQQGSTALFTNISTPTATPTPNVTPTATTTPTPPPTGDKLIIKNVANNQCLEVIDDLNMTTANCVAGKSAQEWVYNAQNQLINGKCLTIYSAAENVMRSNCSASATSDVNARQWVYDTQTLTLKNSFTNKCLFLDSNARAKVTTCTTGNEQKWNLLSTTNPTPSPSPTPTASPTPSPSPSPTPVHTVAIKNAGNNQCLEAVSDMSINTAPCVSGKRTQVWTYNTDKQLINAKCLAPFADNGYNLLANCQVKVSWQWLYDNATLALKNQGNNQCLTIDAAGKTKVAACNGASEQQWNLPENALSNDLVAKNDSYNVTANSALSQDVDILATAGVEVNDLPSGHFADRRFEVAPDGYSTVNSDGSINIRRIAGTGTGTATLYFRESGGFYISLDSYADTPEQRLANKRGTFQFSYKLKQDGFEAQATVTLNVN